LLDGSKKNFQSDPIVKSILGDQKNESINFLSGIDVNQIDAYVIVFTDCPRSKSMARALYSAIRELENPNLKDNPILMVYNQSDVERPQPKKLSEYLELVKYANLITSSNKDTDDSERKSLIEIDELQKKLKQKFGEYSDKLDYIEKTFVSNPIPDSVVVRAKTGYGFRKYMKKLLNLLEDAPNANKRIVTGKNITSRQNNSSRTGCSVPSACEIQ